MDVPRIAPARRRAPPEASRRAHGAARGPRARRRLHGPEGRRAPEGAPGVDPTAHFLSIETEGRAADGRFFRHEATVFLDVCKRCELPRAGLAIRRVSPSKDEKGAFDIELAAKAPAFFAWLADPPDPRGRFSDNLVTVLPGAPRVIRYRPSAPVTAAALRRRLALMDLRNSYG